MNDKKIESILNEVKRYFGFLFEMGYQVQSVDYHPESAGNWEVVLRSKDCFLEISNDRGEVMVYFIPLNGDGRYRIGIKAMIYYLTQGQKFIDFHRGNRFWEKNKQFDELAKLLKEYINQITPYFGDNFHDYREELLSAQRNHFDRAVNRRMEERKK
jgi:hypothetical protein